MSANANEVGAIQLPCPRCLRVTPSLKSYRMPAFVLFLVVAAGAQHATYTCCPSCMRKNIALNFVLNLLPANVAMILLGPLYLVHFLRTFTSGHSRAIEEKIRAIRTGRVPAVIRPA